MDSAPTDSRGSMRALWGVIDGNVSTADDGHDGALRIDTLRDNVALAQGVLRLEDAWQSPSAADDVVCRRDLVRFANIKQQGHATLAVASTRTMDRGGCGRSVDASPAERAWLAFKQMCNASSGGRLGADCLERFWAHYVTERTIRHSTFLSEEILLLCIPAMTTILTVAVERAAAHVASVEAQRTSLALHEPWATLCSALDRRMQCHEAYCERIELDEWVSSEEKGAALQTLLALRAEQDDLEEQLRSAQTAMAPQLDAARAAHDLASRRLVAHCTCRAQGRTVMQHLPSFECTVASDRSNELWRPVQAALLFCAWELETRQLHEAHRDWLASRSQTTSDARLPEDEVAYVHHVLRDAMQTTVVSHDAFVRIAAAVERL